MLLLLDTSLSTLQENLRNERRTSPSQLWSSTALHKSISKQIFQLIAPADLLEIFQLVFNSPINNVIDDRHCNFNCMSYKNKSFHVNQDRNSMDDLRLSEKFEIFVAHFMKPSSWITVTNSNNKNNNNNNNNIDNDNNSNRNDNRNNNVNNTNNHNNNDNDKNNNNNNNNNDTHNKRDTRSYSGYSGGDYRIENIDDTNSNKDKTSIGWTIFSFLLIALETARKMTTSIPNNYSSISNPNAHLQNFLCDRNDIERNRSNVNKTSINNNHNNSDNYNFNSFDLNDNIEISDSLAKVIIILFLVKRVSIPLLLPIQLRLFSAIPDFEFTSLGKINKPTSYNKNVICDQSIQAFHKKLYTKNITINKDYYEEKEMMSKNKMKRLIRLNRKKEKIRSLNDTNNTTISSNCSQLSSTPHRNNTQIDETKPITKCFSRQFESIFQFQIHCDTLLRPHCAVVNSLLQSLEKSVDPLRLLYSAGDVSADVATSSSSSSFPFSHPSSSSPSRNNDHNAEINNNSSSSCNKNGINNNNNDNNNGRMGMVRDTADGTITIFSSPSSPKSRSVSPKLNTNSPKLHLEPAKVRTASRTDSPKLCTDSPKPPRASLKVRVDSPIVRTYSPKARTDSMTVLNVPDQCLNHVEVEEENEEKRKQLSISNILNGCSDKSAVLLIPLNNNDLKGLELLVAAAIQRFERVREAVLSNINKWMNPAPIWEGHNVRTGLGTESPKPWDGLKRNRGEAGVKRINARRDLLEEKLLKNLPSEADLVLVRQSMERNNGNGVSTRPLAAEDSEFLLQAIQEEREGSKSNVGVGVDSDMNASHINTHDVPSVFSNTKSQSMGSDQIESTGLDQVTIVKDAERKEKAKTEGLIGFIKKEEQDVIKRNNEDEGEGEKESEDGNNDETGNKEGEGDEEEQEEEEKEKVNDEVKVDGLDALRDSARMTAIQLMRDSLNMKSGLKNDSLRTQNRKSLSIIVPSNSSMPSSKLPTPVPPPPSAVRAKRTDLFSLAHQIIYPDLRTVDHEMRFRSTVTSSLSSGLLALARSNGIIFPPPSSSFTSSSSSISSHSQSQSQSHCSSSKYSSTSPRRSSSSPPPSSSSSTASTPRRLLLSSKGNIFNAPETDDQKRKKNEDKKRIEAEEKEEESALLLLMKPLGALLDGTLLNAISWQHRLVRYTILIFF